MDKNTERKKGKKARKKIPPGRGGKKGVEKNA